ncbi:histidine phosphatase family protein [Nereida sp. MMG025]|uniref:histidine phosphatase family protein n=1 Tax=Nereida sp. MMG025 TaxID=2909981 RepID=UPI001F2A4916|nr:histidine phosphatase family protein [Nereida sp. MMG025]MCF6445544.1 histidine phosphatase family protein [Nereida sp. MMG025]
MTLWMVRHGPTHAKTMVGHADIPADLSDTNALGRLSAFLPDAPVVSSDLIRATATADAIQAHRTRLPHHSDLREIDFGDWDLKRFDEIQDQAHIRKYWEEPGNIAPPNGESWNAVYRRVSDTIDALRAEHSELIIVCHFGVILTQVQRALSIPAYDAFAHKIDNLSVTKIDEHGASFINYKP